MLFRRPLAEPGRQGSDFIIGQARDLRPHRLALAPPGLEILQLFGQILPVLPGQ